MCRYVFPGLYQSMDRQAKKGMEMRDRLNGMQIIVLLLSFYILKDCGKKTQISPHCRETSEHHTIYFQHQIRIISSNLFFGPEIRAQGLYYVGGGRKKKEKKKAHEGRAC